MNWNYITGFFDADGSVTLSKINKDKNKTLQISFHNNEINILKDIRDFIYKDLGYKGSLSIKKSKKENHQDSFTLKYSYKAALLVGNKMSSIHPKKRHRIEIYNKIQLIIPRNGKYSKELIQENNKLEEEFWNH